MSVRSAIAGIIAAAVLGGCSGGILINDPVFQQNYVDGDFEFATQNGELRTSVYGVPFAMNKARFDTLVTGHMKGAALGRDVAFRTKTQGRGSGAYHAVLIFNPERGTSPYEACSAPDKVPTATGGEALALLAAFCIGDTLLSTADGLAVGVTGTSDARFRTLIRQVTLAFIPAYDHLDVGGDSTRN